MEKGPHFFKGEGRAPPGSPMSESDNKINIFRNYSAHYYIKIHSRMHPVALFHKKILGRANPRIRPLAIEHHYTHARQRKQDVLQYPPCLNMDFYP